MSSYISRLQVSREVSDDKIVNVIENINGCDSLNVRPAFIILISCIFMLLCLSNANANPSGANVINGQVSINTSTPGVMNITNSPNAIINWQNFSNSQSEITRFIQQHSQSAVLNRVIGGNPSNILGQLLSNGQVFLINPNGIVFGAGSVIDTQGLLASTLNISNDDFLNGNFHFIAGSSTADILNEGIIHAGKDGNVVLIAPNINNSGIIQTDGGSITLAAGEELSIASMADPSIRFQVQAAENEALNLGELLANGGVINVFAGQISNSGAINANAVDVDANGQINLIAVSDITLTDTGVVSANGSQGDGGTINIVNSDGIVRNTGVITADSATNDGGTISLAGDWFGLGGTISASGEQTGGDININAEGLSLADTLIATGNQEQGGSIDIRVNTTTWESSSSTVNANGATGGSITHIAGQQITTSGTYTAEGLSGIGGNIDISAPATKLLSAQISADGTSGGQVRIGGEYQGGKNLVNDEIPNAQILAVSSGTTISAKATSDYGNGGYVIVWADLQAEVYANVETYQGVFGIDPGFIEISAAENLIYGGLANAGIGGTVLFDPKNITVQDPLAGGGISQYNLIFGYNYSDVEGFDNAGPILQEADSLSAVSLDGTRLALGLPQDDGADNSVSGSGSVYLYSFSDLEFSDPTLESVLGVGYTGGKNIDLSSQLTFGDEFGGALSLNGNRLAVGAEKDGGLLDTATNYGAVYLFSFTDSVFSGGQLESTLGVGYEGFNDLDLTSELGADFFGHSVSLDGNRLAVGSIFDDASDNLTSNAGAVYLFSFSDATFSSPNLEVIIGSGYTGGKYLDLDLLDVGDNFGYSVSLLGNQLAVGARTDDGAFDNVFDSGAVHLFTFSDSAFNAATLVGSIGADYSGTKSFDMDSIEFIDGGDEFGSSVSLTGTQLAIGSPKEQGGSNVLGISGAVYLFNFTDTSFSSPSLEAVIGANYNSGKDYDMEGSLELGDLFGTSVSLDNNRLIASARGGDGFGNSSNGSGEAYFFSFTDSVFNGVSLDGVWGDGHSGGVSLDLGTRLDGLDLFGSSVSLDGTRLTVGARRDDGFGDESGNSGAVYLYSFSDLTFNSPLLEGVIGIGYTGGKNVDISSFLDPNDEFGAAVSLDGNRLAVGAELGDGLANSLGNVGEVYLFTFSDSVFSNALLQSRIGYSYVGAKDLDLSSELSADDRLGVSVSLDGDRLAIGAVHDDGLNLGAADYGAVYLVSFSDQLFSNPTLEAVIGSGKTGGNNLDIAATLDAGDFFGSSVSLDGTRLAVGALGDDGATDVLNGVGAIYLFSFSDALFSDALIEGVIGSGYTGGKNIDLSANIGTSDWFGTSVALDGSRLVVGAPGDDAFDGFEFQVGAVYSLMFTDLAFNGASLDAIIGDGYTAGANFDIDSFLEQSDVFGTAVSLDGTRLVVGAPHDDGFENKISSSGAAYIFELDSLGGSGNDVADAIFNTSAGSDFTIAPSSLTDILNLGSNVLLQANNDITVAQEIFTDEGGGGGDLILQAGRSIFINADIDTDGGALSALANMTLADGVVDAFRDPGVAVIDIADGVLITTGGNNVFLSLADGAGLTNNTSGDISFGELASINTSGGSILMHNYDGGLVMKYGIDGASITTIGGSVDLLVNDIDLQGASAGWTHIDTSASVAGDVTIIPWASGTAIGIGDTVPDTGMHFGTEEFNAINMVSSEPGLATLTIGGVTVSEILIETVDPFSFLNLTLASSGGIMTDALDLGIGALTIQVGDGAIAGSPDLILEGNLTAGSITLSSLCSGTCLGGTLWATDATNTWNITGVDEGSLTSTTFSVDPTFSNMSSLIGGSGDDTFVFSDGSLLEDGAYGFTSATAGNDVLDLGALSGPVIIETDVTNNTIGPNGQTLAFADEVIGSDNGTTISNTTTEAATVTFSGLDSGVYEMATNDPIIFSVVDSFSGGTAVDNYLFTTASSINGSIDGGGGLDVLSYAGSTDLISVDFETNVATGIGGSFTNLDVFVGGAGVTDVFTGTNSGDTWSLDSINGGVLNATYFFTGFENIQGGSSSDSFQISSTFTETLLAGDGDDTFSILSGESALIGGSFEGEAGADSITIQNGATLDFVGGQLEAEAFDVSGIFNWSGGIINAVSGLDISTSGVFNIDGDLAINAAVTNAGILRKSSGAGIALLDSEFVNTATGLLDIDVGILQVDSDNWTNSGTIDVASGAEFLLFNGLIPGDLTNNGTLQGSGSYFVNSLVNNGAFRPGSSPGILVIDGDIVFGPSGTLFLDITGLSQGGSYDLLDVFGSATLDGTLNINTIPYGGQAVGDSFEFIVGSGLSGTFSNQIFTSGYGYSLSIVGGGLIAITTAIPGSGSGPSSVTPGSGNSPVLLIPEIQSNEIVTLNQKTGLEKVILNFRQGAGNEIAALNLLPATAAGEEEYEEELNEYELLFGTETSPVIGVCR